MRAPSILLFGFGLAVGVFPAGIAEAQSARKSFSIMTEEPGVLPPNRSVMERDDNGRALRKEWRQRQKREQQERLNDSGSRPLPRVVVPGIAPVPNLPVINQGNGGRETFQDRAIRCSHQSSLYGVPGSQAGAYVNNCAMN